MKVFRKTARLALLSVACIAVSSAAVSAETLKSALAKAYATNPDLNAQRASVRATDEGVPQALAGYRPTVSATADYGIQNTTTRGVGGTSGVTNPGSVGITISQPVFQGFRTRNNTKAAKAQVLAARSVLANTEQNVLLQAVQAYMNVLRDESVLNLRRQNVFAIQQELTAARDRFEVGEGTRTDIAQAEARLSQSSSQVNLAESNLAASRATYRQVIGVEPRGLAPGAPFMSLVPSSLTTALAIALKEHPAIVSAQYNVDAASFQVSAAEGELLPNVSLEGSVSRRWESSTGANTVDSASLVGRVSVPIYQAGSVSSRIRQAKEVLGQRRLELDSFREQVRASVVSSYNSLLASRASADAARKQVSAQRLALEGVTEEQKVGQRTTLDVLNSQQELIEARVTQVTAERDTVVASFSLLSSIGKLTADSLNLAVAQYKPEEHYDQVKDKWFGIRTPDGR
jgi:outer membrane protein